MMLATPWRLLHPRDPVDIVPGCQGLTLDLDDVWSELDALADAVEDR